MENNVVKTRIDKPVFFMSLQMGVTIILLVVITLFTLRNLSGLKSFINERTHAYAKDIAFQLASDITTEFNSRKMSMAVVADSLKNTVQTSNTEELQEFLDRKEALSVFDDFFFVGIDDIHSEQAASPLPSLPHSIVLPHLKLFSHESDVHDHTCIHYDGEHNIFYTQQISDGQKTMGMLIGIRHKTRVQEMIQPKAFNSQAVSCIIDSGCNVIIAPQGYDGGGLPDMVRANNDSQQIAVQLETLREFASRQEPYTTEVDTIRHGRLMLVYTPLGINDWGLTTFIPSSILRGQSDTYIFRTLVTTVVSIAVFLLLTILTFFSYKKNKNMMQRVVFSDSVTGGLNDAGFRIQYHESVKKSSPNTYCVLLMNIKNFKLINEQFGTEEGDKTLRYIYATIKECLTKNEFVARTESDNFFICLKESDPKIISERAEGIVSMINGFNNDDEKTPYHLVVHRGACIVSEPQQKISIVQGHAKAAYKVSVQQNTEECIFYDKSFTENKLKEIEINNMFGASIRNHDFKVYLQPKIRLLDGKIGGAEALVRWQHPEKGMIFPNDFIPVFEKNGKICQLDLYMFTEVCKLIASWQKEGRELFPVSVNLSRQHFHTNTAFLDKFHAIAQQYNIPENILEFELTESIFFDQNQIVVVKESIKRMHELGFLCSLDDFGIGFSSLSLLKEFDIDTIKFDRQFFMDISTKKSKDIIGSMIDLSSKLGMHTVAEGIETQEQVSYLDSAKCDMIQGYVFSKPLPLEEFEKWINKTNS